MKSSTELRNAKKAKREALPLAPPPKQQSWLERLPAELIEQIFFHSLEVNMARASSFIGKVLAKESVYKVLILFAFYHEFIPPFQIEYMKGKSPVERKHFAPATYRTLSVEQRRSLQRGVLNTRWCTSERIERQLPTISRLQLIHRWHTDRAMELWPKDKVGLAAGIMVSRDEMEVPTKLPDPANDQKLVNYYTGRGVLPDRKYHFSDGQTSVIFISNEAIQCLPGCVLSPGSWISPSPHNSSRDTPNGSPGSMSDSSTKKVRSEAFKMLRLLLSFTKPRSINQMVDHYPSLLRGVETAIREQDPSDVLSLLYHVVKSIFLHPGPVLDPFSYREEWRKLIRLASQQSAGSRWLVKELFEALPYKLVDRDDPVLMKWALQMFDPSRLRITAEAWLLEKRFKSTFRDFKGSFFGTPVRTLETEEDENQVSYPELLDEQDRMGGLANVARFMEFSDSEDDENSSSDEYQNYLEQCEEGPESDSKSESTDTDNSSEWSVDLASMREDEYQAYKYACTEGADDVNSDEEDEDEDEEEGEEEGEEDQTD